LGASGSFFLSFYTIVLITQPNTIGRGAPAVLRPPWRPLVSVLKPPAFPARPPPPPPPPPPPAKEAAAMAAEVKAVAATAAAIVVRVRVRVRG